MFIYRDDVAERLVNGEFYSNPNQTEGLLEPSPQDEKNWITSKQFKL